MSDSSKGSKLSEETTINKKLLSDPLIIQVTDLNKMLVKLLLIGLVLWSHVRV